MTANTSLLLSNPDFPSIRASFRDFLRSQEQFQDYNFDGSNLSVFLDILAYNNYQEAFLTSMAATEMFLDTAQVDSSVISRAKELNYVPRSFRSAAAFVDIQVVPSDEPDTITLSKGQSFSSTVGTRSFTFSTDSVYIIAPDANNEYKVSNVQIFEGFYITEQFTFDSSITNQLFTLSNVNVDTRSIEVTVNGVAFVLATSIIDLVDDSHIFFVQLSNDGHYQIYFGDNVLGLSPSHQAQILVTYRVAAGIAANDSRTFSINSSVGPYSNVIVTTVSAALGGANPETIESVRRNAPSNFSTRNRAVTATDYENLLSQQFPEITSIHVFGGDTMDPPEYGKVFVCVDVEGADGAPQTSLVTYQRYIKNKSPVTIDTVFIEPKFLNLTLNIKAYYDYINFGVVEADIRADILTAVNNFNDTFLNKFDTTFKFSQFVKYVDAANEAIISNDSEVLMTLTANSTLLSSQTQSLSFDNTLDTSLQSVSSSQFIYKGLTCSIRDDRAGTLQIITNIQSASPVIVTNVGKVDYTSGGIILSPIAFDSLLGAGLKFFGRAESSNIAAIRNTIIKIDIAGITVTPVPTKP